MSHKTSLLLIWSTRKSMYRRKKLSEVEKSINYLNIQLEENKEPNKNEVKEDEIKIYKL